MCLQHVRGDAARRAGLSATADAYYTSACLQLGIKR